MMTLLCIAGMLFISDCVHAKNYEFDPSPDNGTYVVLWGNKKGGPYTHYKQIGKNTTFTSQEIGIPHNRSGVYFIVVYIYNKNGMSLYSNEVMFRIGSYLKLNEGGRLLDYNENGVILKE